MIECAWDENDCKSRADCSEKRKHIVTTENADRSKEVGNISEDRKQ